MARVKRIAMKPGREPSPARATFLVRGVPVTVFETTSTAADRASARVVELVDAGVASRPEIARARRGAILRMLRRESPESAACGLGEVITVSSDDIGVGRSRLIVVGDESAGEQLALPELRTLLRRELELVGRTPGATPRVFLRNRSSVGMPLEPGVVVASLVDALGQLSAPATWLPEVMVTPGVEGRGLPEVRQFEHFADGDLLPPAPFRDELLERVPVHGREALKNVMELLERGVARNGLTRSFDLLVDLVCASVLGERPAERGGRALVPLLDGSQAGEAADRMGSMLGASRSSRVHRALDARERLLSTSREAGSPAPDEGLLRDACILLLNALMGVPSAPALFADPGRQRDAMTLRARWMAARMPELVRPPVGEVDAATFHACIKRSLPIAEIATIAGVAATAGLLGAVAPIPVAGAAAILGFRTVSVYLAGRDRLRRSGAESETQAMKPSPGASGAQASPQLEDSTPAIDAALVPSLPAHADPSRTLRDLLLQHMALEARQELVAALREEKGYRGSDRNVLLEFVIRFENPIQLMNTYLEVSALRQIHQELRGIDPGPIIKDRIAICNEAARALGFTIEDMPPGPKTLLKRARERRRACRATSQIERVRQDAIDGAHDLESALLCLLRALSMACYEEAIDTVARREGWVSDDRPMARQAMGTLLQCLEKLRTALLESTADRVADLRQRLRIPGAPLAGTQDLAFLRNRLVHPTEADLQTSGDQMRDRAEAFLEAAEAFLDDVDRCEDGRASIFPLVIRVESITLDRWGRRTIEAHTDDGQRETLVTQEPLRPGGVYWMYPLSNPVRVDPILIHVPSAHHGGIQRATGAGGS